MSRKPADGQVGFEFKADYEGPPVELIGGPMKEGETVYRPQVRMCVKCGDWKEIKNFRVHTRKHGIVTYRYISDLCRKCEKQELKAYYKTDIGRKARARHRRTERLKRYNLDDVSYSRMLEIQNNSCAICGCGVEDNSGIALHVDHCHSTLKVRGILCNLCNGGLGRFKDNPELLRKAADYIEKHRIDPSGEGQASGESHTGNGTGGNGLVAGDVG